MMVEIVKAFDGTEYKAVKKNRVNWIVEDLKTGNRLQGNGRMFTHVRFEEEKKETVDPLIRIGAVVRVKESAPIWMNAKFSRTTSKKQAFVIMGFGKSLGDFKCITLGGNEGNRYWEIPGSSLELANL